MALPDLLLQLHAIALQAGKRVLELRASGSLDPREKTDGTLVSRADLEAHDLILGGLRARFPGVPVISEEAPIPVWEVRRAWPRHFLVDPLDGSKGYLKGEDEFTVNIALLKDADLEAAVVHHPPSGLSFSALRGVGAWRGEKPMGRRDRFPSIPRAIDSRHHSSARVAEHLKSMGVREVLSCSSALKHCHIAEGLAEVYASFKGTWAWDTAASQLLLAECGMRMVEMETGRDLAHHRENLANPPLIVCPPHLVPGGSGNTPTA